MKKTVRVLVFLALTVLWALCWPRLTRREEAPRPGPVILRVWNAETESAVGAWLRNRATAYEKETGQRVYLRAASARDAESALKDGLPPDVLVGPDEGVPVALRGYGLFVRDDEKAPLSPAPTGALFFRPSPSPGPAASPAPRPDETALSAVLAPPELESALPGTVPDRQAAASFFQGKARAALLTAGQASSIPFGYRAYALPEGKGFLPVAASSYTDAGAAFLRFLHTDASQRALASFGLYSSRLGLYGPEDPLRALIESGLSRD